MIIPPFWLNVVKLSAIPNVNIYILIGYPKQNKCQYIFMFSLCPTLPKERLQRRIPLSLKANPLSGASVAPFEWRARLRSPVTHVETKFCPLKGDYRPLSMGRSPETGNACWKSFLAEIQVMPANVLVGFIDESCCKCKPVIFPGKCRSVRNQYPT